MDQKIIGIIKSEFSQLLKRYQFDFLSFPERKEIGLGLTEQEYKNRGSTSLIWRNENFFLEIYSDPQGGKTNCRLAKRATGSTAAVVWRYLYELNPLTSEELSRIRSHRRSDMEQLEMIREKLEVGLPRLLAAGE